MYHMSVTSLRYLCQASQCTNTMSCGLQWVFCKKKNQKHNGSCLWGIITCNFKKEKLSTEGYLFDLFLKEN